MRVWILTDLLSLKASFDCKLLGCSVVLKEHVPNNNIREHNEGIWMRMDAYGCIWMHMDAGGWIPIWEGPAAPIGNRAQPIGNTLIPMGYTNQQQSILFLLVFPIDIATKY